jgi:hypothetical protein
MSTFRRPVMNILFEEGVVGKVERKHQESLIVFQVIYFRQIASTTMTTVLDKELLKSNNQ